MSVQKKQIKQLAGADIIVQTLEHHDVKWVFGIPGAKIDKVFNTLVDSSIQTVVCRHEQNAAFIAGGIGRMTGKAGVAIATSGPGVSNLVTGLATANTEGDPVVALGGAVAISERLKQVHQTMDSVSICKPVTKFSAEIDSPESTAEVLTNAFRIAETDRPGAVYVSLPKDIMAKPAECEVLAQSGYLAMGPADERAIQEAARLLNQSKKPVVLLGLLASKPENAAAVHEFLERGKLPVVGTFQAAGSVPLQLFHNFGGRVGLLANQPADMILKAADLVVTVGYDAVEYDPPIWNKGRQRPVVHIDALRADIDNAYNPAVELIGDIAASAASEQCCERTEGTGDIRREAERRPDSPAPSGYGVTTAPDTRHDALLRHGLISYMAGAPPVQLPGAPAADGRRTANAWGCASLGHCSDTRAPI
jgi:acetolactate synthase-1/2/3 large subunit